MLEGSPAGTRRGASSQAERRTGTISLAFNVRDVGGSVRCPWVPPVMITALRLGSGGGARMLHLRG
jgi:hypothetical protein